MCSRRWQCGRRRHRHGLRARGDVSNRRQHRRWRLHGDPLPRRSRHHDRLPREGAARGARPNMFLDSTGAYSSRDPPQHAHGRGRAGHRGRIRAGAREVRQRRVGCRWWTPPSRWRGRLCRAHRDSRVHCAARAAKLSRYPASLAAYYNNGEPYAEGATLVPARPREARSTRIRDQGRDGFYKGETARLVVAEMRRDGGLITEADLARYEAKERDAGARARIAASTSSPCRRRAPVAWR